MIELRYWNESLQIGLADWKTGYQFPQKELMEKEIHQGNLSTELRDVTEE